ncbi:prolactin receptor precursor [Ovis aries]|uniref:Isoform 3 of Prolactin receptor n=1 Tax=Ovis aries TaxID=9940 RepID=O46561-3|nr:prolactin receptor precursor [Ovis aries]AAB96965.1 prolactin receptor soluble form [Ovis aries]
MKENAASRVLFILLLFLFASLLNASLYVPGGKCSSVCTYMAYPFVGGIFLHMYLCVDQYLLLTVTS